MVCGAVKWASASKPKTKSCHKKASLSFFRKATRHFFINLKKGEILFSTFNNFMGFYGMANNILNFLCFNLTLFNDERWTRQVANLELKYNNNDDIKLVMTNMMIIVRWGHWLTFFCRCWNVRRKAEGKAQLGRYFFLCCSERGILFQ